MIEVGKAAVGGPNGYQVWNNEFGDVFCISSANDANPREELWITMTTLREVLAHCERINAAYDESERCFPLDYAAAWNSAVWLYTR